MGHGYGHGLCSYDGRWAVENGRGELESIIYDFVFRALCCTASDPKVIGGPWLHGFAGGGSGAHQRPVLADDQTASVAAAEENELRMKHPQLSHLSTASLYTAVAGDRLSRKSRVKCDKISPDETTA